MELLERNNFEITYQIWGVRHYLDKNSAKSINSIKSIQRHLQVSSKQDSTNICLTSTKNFRYREFLSGREDAPLGRKCWDPRKDMQQPTSGEDSSRQRPEQEHQSQTHIKSILIFGASLVAQWLRSCLPMQGTRVWALVWEDPTCRGATGPVRHNYWACASGACAPQQERPR